MKTTPDKLTCTPSRISLAICSGLNTPEEAAISFAIADCGDQRWNKSIIKSEYKDKHSAQGIVCHVYINTKECNILSNLTIFLGIDFGTRSNNLCKPSSCLEPTGGHFHHTSQH